MQLYATMILLQSEEAKDLGITAYYNYTEEIEQIKDQVLNYTSVEECCDYQYQILDKFCASRTVVSMD